jgi:hypothetical protein
MSTQFLQLFSDPAPALRVKFDTSDEEEKAKLIHVQHRLGSIATPAGQQYLEPLGALLNMGEFREFYLKHDGAELCRVFPPLSRQEKPLLEFKPAGSIAEFSGRYMPGGDRAWTMDLNKSKTLYRSSVAWIAFAEIDNGPACLTIFLDGENAGYIYFVTPQPQFNILRPIAKGFQPLLDRIAKDLAAFLRLVRATVTLRGTDGDNYGFAPIEYLANANSVVAGLHAANRRTIHPPH